MKTLLSLLLSSAIFIAQLAHAHGDHDYQPPRAVSESVALLIAQRATTSMTRKDAGLGALTVYKKGSGYYVVSVLNEKVKKTLYLLMSDSGEVYDANLNGEFNGID